MGNGVTPVEFEAGQDENHSRFLQKITVGDKVFTVTEVASQTVIIQMKQVELSLS